MTVGDEIRAARDRFGARADDPLVFFLAEIAAQLAELNTCQKEYLRFERQQVEEAQRRYESEGKRAAQTCTEAMETLAGMARLVGPAGPPITDDSPPHRPRRPRH